MDKIKEKGLTQWLVIRCKQGESQALEGLLKLWQQRYFLYAVNRLRDNEAAKDVTQECLISIGKNINRLADAAAYKKWSSTILERRCIDWQRKTIRDRELIQTPPTIPEVAVTDGVDRKLTVEQALKQLDRRTSVILRLYYLEELSVGEIAEIAELPLGTVKSRLFYGRKLLANSLGETDE